MSSQHLVDPELMPAVNLLPAMELSTDTLAAWRAGPQAGSCFHDPCSSEAALAREIGELREFLSLPREGLSRRARGLHPDAPKSPA